MSYVRSTPTEGETAQDNRRTRRQELARGWRFSCECSKCAEEAEALMQEDVIETPATAVIETAPEVVAEAAPEVVTVATTEAVAEVAPEVVADNVAIEAAPEAVSETVPEVPVTEE